MFRMTEFFDSYGPMAKSTADLISLLEIILGRPLQIGTLLLPSKWESLAVGFVDPKIWKLAPEMCRQKDGTFEQMVNLKAPCQCGGSIMLTTARWMTTKQWSRLCIKTDVQSSIPSSFQTAPCSKSMDKTLSCRLRVGFTHHCQLIRHDPQALTNSLPRLGIQAYRPSEVHRGI